MKEVVEEVKVLLVQTLAPMLKRGTVTVTETKAEIEKEMWL